MRTHRGSLCRIDACDWRPNGQITFDGWRNRVRTLTGQLNDSKPMDSCLTAQTANSLAGHSAWPTGCHATLAVALLVLLVAAAAR